MKIIHYCWFGGRPHPPLVKACIQSWQNYCPDYEIKEWNEGNFNIELPFLKRAINDKKWAFVADYVRLAVLFEYGGIYLDTDMELTKSLNTLPDIELLLGYESHQRVSFGAIAMRKQSQIGKQLLDYWVEDFSTRRDYLAIPAVLSPLITQLQSTSPERIRILPERYFYPYNPYDKNRSIKQLLFSDISDDTVAIHHWMNSWSNKNSQPRKNTHLKFKSIIKNILHYLPNPIVFQLKKLKTIVNQYHNQHHLKKKSLPSHFEKKNNDVSFFKKNCKISVLESGVLFIHIPKAAGTSIVSALYNRSEWTHLNYDDYFNELGKDTIRSIKLFSIVRNPYDRLFLAFQYLHSSTNYFDQHWCSHHLKEKNFERFIINWLTVKNVEHCLIDHFKTQSSFLAGNTSRANIKVWKIEELKEKEISEYIDYDIVIPFKNVGNKSLAKPKWSKEMIDRVNKVYAEDFKQFNYTMIDINE